MREIDRADLSGSLVDLVCDQEFAGDLAALVCITTRFDRIWQKYKHSRAYRTALLDIGHLSQTFHLTAAALGVCSWLTAAFEDDKLASVLKLRGDVESPMFVLGLGHGTGDYLHPSFRNALAQRRRRMNWLDDEEAPDLP